MQHLSLPHSLPPTINKADNNTDNKRTLRAQSKYRDWPLVPPTPHPTTTTASHIHLPKSPSLPPIPPPRSPSIKRGTHAPRASTPLPLLFRAPRARATFYTHLSPPGGLFLLSKVPSTSSSLLCSLLSAASSCAPPAAAGARHASPGLSLFFHRGQHQHHNSTRTTFSFARMFARRLQPATPSRNYCFLAPPSRPSSSPLPAAPLALFTYLVAVHRFVLFCFSRTLYALISSSATTNIYTRTHPPATPRVTFSHPIVV